MKLRSALRDATVVTLLTAALFAGIEGALAVCGLGERQGRIARGFDAAEPFLRPHPEVEGAWITRLHGGGSAERTIPPRDGRVRVVLFGGSNTEGLPEQLMERCFAERTGRDSHEVVNLGRSGYGSTRVAFVVREAVAKLEPDVVVIYAGHNEFVERSFRLDLERAPGRTAIASVAAESRAANLVAGWMERTDGSLRAAGRDAPDRLEPDWTWEYEKFRGLPYAETLETYAAYGENLRASCRDALEGGARVLLCTLVYNQLAAPFVPGCADKPGGADDARAREVSAAVAEARGLLPPAFHGLLPLSEESRVHRWDWRGGERHGRAERVRGGDELRPPGLRECEGVLAERDQVRVPREGWNETVWALLEANGAVFGGVAEEDRAAVERAEEVLRRAVERCPDHSGALFSLALVELALGRDPSRAVERLERAGRFDRAPRRANAAVNEVVREVALELDGVELHDAYGQWRDRMPDGLIGWEWMQDHCHLSLGARQVFVNDLARAVLERWPAAGSRR